MKYHHVSAWYEEHGKVIPREACITLHNATVYFHYSITATSVFASWFQLFQRLPCVYLTRPKDLLRLQLAKTITFQSSFKYSGAKIWNELPSLPRN